MNNEIFLKLLRSHFDERNARMIEKFSLGVCRIAKISETQIEYEFQFFATASIFSVFLSKTGFLLTTIFIWEKVFSGNFYYPAVIAYIRLKL